MPKSRIRTKKGRNPQKSKADLKRIEEGYFKKLDEFLELPLEELQELVKSKTIKGIYARSLEAAIDQKEQIQLQIEKNKEVEPV